jgi:probable phosphomutase (TIGR03848 family)
MTTIFLIRHAETDAVGNWIAGRSPGVHLNRVGLTQAQRLAEGLAGVPFAAMYSSPIERAVETAEPLADGLGLPVVERQALSEIDFGEWTGRTLAELDADRGWRLFNSFRSSYPIPGGESMIRVQARIVAEITCLARLHPSQTIAAVSHGDVIRAAVAHYAGIPLDLLERFEISPASVTILKLSEETAVLTRLNDTASSGA